MQTLAVFKGYSEQMFKISEIVNIMMLKNIEATGNSLYKQVKIHQQKKTKRRIAPNLIIDFIFSVSWLGTTYLSAS